MNASLLLLVPVLLPLLFGVLLGFCRPLQEGRAQRVFLVGALTLNAVVVLALLFQGDMGLELFRLSDRLPLMFKLDDLARIFCALAAIIFLLVGIYCPVYYMRHEGNEARFYMFFLFAQGMVMGFALSGNLLTLYLFFEMATLLSMPLVLHSMKKEALSAALKYLYYSIAGAALSLVAFFFIFSYGVTLDFTPGGVLDMQKLAGNEDQMLFVSLLAIIGFGAKAGMFPLHAWLPVAHPVAPSPASALLSGLITKVGIFAVIRFVYYIVGADFIGGTWVQTAWIIIALFTGIMGSLLAFGEHALKRRLAYSTISQIGYIMFGLALLTAGGFTGALLQVVFHAIAKSGLFLVAGALILKTQYTEVAELRGIGKRMPVSMWCFALFSLSLVGIPPLAGFTGKWFLTAGSLASDTGFFTWLGPVVLLFSALLAAGYLLPIVIKGFLTGAKHDNSQVKCDPEISMKLPILLFAAASVLFGIFSGGLVSLFERIALELL